MTKKYQDMVTIAGTGISYRETMTGLHIEYSGALYRFTSMAGGWLRIGSDDRLVIKPGAANSIYIRDAIAEPTGPDNG